MNSSSHAGSTISCPHSPPTSKAATIFTQCNIYSAYFYFTKTVCSAKETKTTSKNKQQTEEMAQHLVLVDIYKTPSERHHAHPCECMRARVIRTRAGMCFVFVLLHGGWYQGQVH